MVVHVAAGGQLWAAGENKEGQCGMGTPLEDLARMHRQAYDEAMWRIGAYLHQQVCAPHTGLECCAVLYYARLQPMLHQLGRVLCG